MPLWSWNSVVNDIAVKIDLKWLLVFGKSGDFFFFIMFVPNWGGRMSDTSVASTVRGLAGIRKGRGGAGNGRPKNLIPWNESRMPNWNSCRISDSNGGIEKPTIKHMGIKIIVRSVGGHDRRQMGTNQCSLLQHPGRDNLTFYLPELLCHICH